MAKSNICYHNMRLNLDNEQHCRVHKVLVELNTEIHKSVNQFIVDAVDYYIRSMDDEDLVNTSVEKKQTAEYITRADLDGVREELKNDVKNEIIVLLGAAFGAGTGRMMEGTTRKNVDIPAEKAADIAGGSDDLTMIELVNSWG